MELCCALLILLHELATHENIFAQYDPPAEAGTYQCVKSASGEPVTSLKMCQPSQHSLMTPIDVIEKRGVQQCMAAIKHLFRYLKSIQNEISFFLKLIISSSASVPVISVLAESPPPLTRCVSWRAGPGLAWPRCEPHLVTPPSLCLPCTLPCSPSSCPDLLTGAHSSPASLECSTAECNNK